MVIDRIENKELYSGLSLRLAAGFGFLAGIDKGTFTEHREAVDGDTVFAIFESYTTQSAEGRFFETHDRHIDIQYVMKGCEIIRVAPRHSLQIHTGYNSVDDITWYQPGEATEVVLRAGWFAILYPHEAHLPQLEFKSPESLMKIVVKVRV